MVKGQPAVGEKNAQAPSRAACPAGRPRSTGEAAAAKFGVVEEGQLVLRG